MPTTYIGKKIIHYDSVESTNTLAKAFAKKGEPEGTLIIAQEQTAGKGRLGKTWTSPKGEGIWMSFILRPNIKLEAVPQLTILAGLSMCLAIQEITQHKIEIKWPNDLVLNNKKVCGVLCESQIIGHKLESVIVGIGVNVDTQHFPKELAYASSLLKETGCTYKKEDIINRFCEIFEREYLCYKQEGNLAKSLEVYKMSCINMNRKVRIIDKEKEFECEVIDIDLNGRLIVQTEDGQVQTIGVGEVSVRGLYGYI